MHPHLVQHLTGITTVTAVRPPAKSGVHTPDNIFPLYQGALAYGQLRYTHFYFYQRKRKSKKVAGIAIMHFSIAFILVGFVIFSLFYAYSNFSVSSCSMRQWFCF